MRAIIRLIRVKQWAKNGFVFVPLFFAGEFINGALLASAAIAFIAFSFAASAIYCLNDLLDVKSDRLHPQKRHRPVASGAISGVQAIVIGALLVAAAVVLVQITGNGRLLYILVAYIVLNVLYSVWLKRLAIVDVVIIAFGFVLRLVAGGVVTGVPLSQWIVLMTFLLALFLAFAKRRDDVLIFEQTGIKARTNIVSYNVTFINSALSILATITIVAYLMYTMSPEVIQRMGTPYLYLTSFFVIAGVLRYLQIAQVDQKSGSPTKVLLTDIFTQINLLLWGLTFAAIIYI